jgi:hypothetical protein
MTTFWHTFYHDGKLAQPDEGEGLHAHPPFTISTITYKVVVYTLQLRGQIHFLYFYSTPIWTLCSTLYTISPPVNKVWPSTHTHTHSHNNMGFHFLFKAELDLAGIATPLGRGDSPFRNLYIGLDSSSFYPPLNPNRIFHKLKIWFKQLFPWNSLPLFF